MGLGFAGRWEEEIELATVARGTPQALDEAGRHPREEDVELARMSPQALDEAGRSQPNEQELVLDLAQG